MAGIGFVLRKLLDKRNLSGTFQAYLHATLAACGPWLLTVVSMGFFYTFVTGDITFAPLGLFRAIILYNFCFSLVLTAPFNIVGVRYLSDLVYQRNLSGGVGMMLGTLCLLYLFAVPLALSFYFLYLDLPIKIALAGALNFLLITGVWQISLFISALKRYTAVTTSFFVGLLTGLIASLYLARDYQLFGTLMGFNLGFAVIYASLLGIIFSEYPRVAINLFGFLAYFRKYFILVAGAFLWNVGIWVDKWIMWFSPDGITLPSGFILFPYYDSSMFLAYLTLVPAMGQFLLKQETTFFEEYFQYYEEIRQHCSMDKIQKNHDTLIHAMMNHSYTLLFLQSFICISSLLLAPRLFELLNINPIQLGMFRIGALGATFQVLTLFLIIFLSYFDHRRAVFTVQATFFLCNALFTYITVQLGFAYYGYGYFLAALTSFTVAAVLTERYLRDLPYHTFISQNSAVN